MNHPRSIPPAALSALAALLGSLGGDVKIHMIPVSIDADSDVPLDDQFAAAVKADLEKTEAEFTSEVISLAAHLDECEYCRKEYDTEVGNVPNDQLQPYQLAIKAAFEKSRAARKAKQAQEVADKAAAIRRDAAQAKQAQDAANKAAAILRDVAQAGTDAGVNPADAIKQTRKPIGYMAFCNGRPVPPSFSEDRAEVEAKAKEFQNEPAIAALDALARAFGKVDGAGEIIVKPVYGE